MSPINGNRKWAAILFPNAKFALTRLEDSIKHDEGYSEAYVLIALANLFLIDEIERRLKEVKIYIDIAFKLDPCNKLSLAGKIELDLI